MNNARRLRFAFVDTAFQLGTSIENHVMAITDMNLCSRPRTKQHARVETSDAFPWGAWPRNAAVTRTSKQAGKALRSQGRQYARVM